MGNILTCQTILHGLHLHVQRRSIINFWKVLEKHAFSSITFNKYIYIKYDILQIFNIFILLLTNFDKLGLKTFNNLSFNFFNLFLGLF